MALKRCTKCLAIVGPKTWLAKVRLKTMGESVQYIPEECLERENQASCSEAVKLALVNTDGDDATRLEHLALKRQARLRHSGATRPRFGSHREAARVINITERRERIILSHLCMIDDIVRQGSSWPALGPSHSLVLIRSTIKHSVDPPLFAEQRLDS